MTFEVTVATLLSLLVRKRCSVQLPSGAPVESFVIPVISAVPFAVTVPLARFAAFPEMLTLAAAANATVPIADEI